MNTETQRFSLNKIFLLLIVGFSLLSCNFSSTNEGETKTGTVSLSLTDAPIADAEGVEGVFITIETISYNLNGQWIEAENFEGPQKFNLLELTGGNVAPLADTRISAGDVAQIRFMLSATEQGQQASGTPGCYIAIDKDGSADGNDSDDEIHSLFVPSGGESGYKATGLFTVPANGTVEITADFDVRKSVVYTGSGFYLLKPTIRLVVNNQAGKIEGIFDAGTTNYQAYSIFAYENDTYNLTEETAADDESAPFPNAISSATAVDSNNDETLDSYSIPFLADGTYDLIVAGIDAEGLYTVIDKKHIDITVKAGAATAEDISISSNYGLLKKDFSVINPLIEYPAITGKVCTLELYESTAKTDF